MKNMPEAQKLWFKRKTYGWGWTPCSWEGWLVIFMYVAALFSYEYYIRSVEPDGNFLVGVIFPVFILTSILIAICYKKGEKPKWQWGGEKKMKLILGSYSKKRKILLEEAGVVVDEVKVSGVDEMAIRSNDFFELPQLLARAKRDALLPQVGNDAYLITADTVLFSGTVLLEKPQDAEEERYFFSLYDGVTPFRFATAVTITNTATGQKVEGLDTGKCLAGPFSSEFVEAWIAKGTYLDYAGGFTYHDQEFKTKLEFIEGSEGGLIGMPVHLVKKLLAEVGYKN